MRTRSRFLHFSVILFASASLLGSLSAVATGGVEDSYHGQLGRSGFSEYGTGLGMLEKWCALPNFSFIKEGGIGDGSFGWTSKDCNNCHVGAPWNPTRPEGDCTFCHSTPGAKSTIADCYRCHVKDTAKRGDMFDAENDAHIAAGFLCQDCHARVSDEWSDHQFLKGTAIDTTEPTMEGTLNCATCHTSRPHRRHTTRGGRLDHHAGRVACETCHTGARPGAALSSRRWDTFTPEGKPVTVKKSPGWLPVYKWYDNVNSATSGGGHLPILGYTERRERPGARIYPFNPVSVSWFLETSLSALEDVIVVSDVKAADADGDRTVTLEEMRIFYPDATLVSRDMNFSINHSVLPTAQAAACDGCHGESATIIDWLLLGYQGDPTENCPMIQTRVTPDSGDFGKVETGHRSSRRIEVRNIGSSALLIDDISLTGSYKSNFSLDLADGSRPCGRPGTSLLPDEFCTLALVFEPQETGTVNVALNITSNDPELPVAVSEFTAAGVTLAPDDRQSSGNGLGGCALGAAGRGDVLLPFLFLLSLLSATVRQRST